MLRDTLFFLTKSSKKLKGTCFLLTRSPVRHRIIASKFAESLYKHYLWCFTDIFSAIERTGGVENNKRSFNMMWTTTLAFIISCLFFQGGQIELRKDYGQDEPYLSFSSQTISLWLINRTDKFIDYDPMVYEIERYDASDKSWKSFYDINVSRKIAAFVKPKQRRKLDVWLPPSEAGLYRVKIVVDVWKGYFGQGDCEQTAVVYFPYRVIE